MRTAVMKRLGKAKEDQKGFTLIELLAVIVILAVIAAIAVPLIGNIINKSKKDADISTARQIYDASKLYVTSELNGANPKQSAAGAADGRILLSELQTKGYIDSALSMPSTKNTLNASATLIQFDTDGKLVNVILTDTPSTGTAKVKTYSPTEVATVSSTQ